MVDNRPHVSPPFTTRPPRVIGQTVEAQQKKSSATRGSRQWDEASFFEELNTQAPAAVEPARAIYEWATNRASRITWGKGKQYGSFYPTLEHQGAEVTPISVQTYGSFSLWFGELKNQPAFAEEHKRLELLRRLNDIPGVTVPQRAIYKYPNIALTTLNNEAALAQFLGVLDWIAQEIRTTT
jgi:hypothetical protein